MSVDELEIAAASSAAAGGSEKRGYVRRMFSQIAPHYDLLNHLLSFGVDRRWRRLGIDTLDIARHPDGVYLDLCAGTLDVAAAIAHRSGFRGKVLGADFSEAMLQSGRGKAPTDVMLPLGADALALPLADGAMAGVIVAFGLRNVADLDAALREALRVLEPDGRFVILELSTPRSHVVRAGYHAYFHHLLPAIGRMVSGHGTAYDYLPESVANFPPGTELARRMTAAGFADVQWRPLTLGVAALHVGRRP